MKNLLILICLFLTFGLSAQKGYVQTIASDTVIGADTIYFETTDLLSGGTVCLGVLCTEVGGTSDGTITIEGSADGKNFFNLTEKTGLISGYPSDSLTITDGSVAGWTIYDNPFAKLRFKVVGTASDSTLISPSYISKN